MPEPEQKPIRGRPKRICAERVRDVAMRAYWHRDPADVSINAICQMAGVSKPSIYREFGSEDGLTLAVLDAYAEQVLAKIIAILSGNLGLTATLNALTVFVVADPRMETGCLFHKMRAGKHRLGPETRARVEEIDCVARNAYLDFLQASSDSGDWLDPLPVEDGARYLSAQLALAMTLRAAGEDAQLVRRLLSLAFSVFQSSNADQMS